MNPLINSLFVSLISQLIFFVYASSHKTDKLTDLSYGLGFVTVAIYCLSTSPNISSYKLVLLTMIILWGARISTYLLLRIIKTGRDSRFDGIRENFWKFARFWLLQGFSVWVISLPAIYLLSLNQPTEINTWAIIGLIIWLSGVFIETLADLQLYKFRFGNHPETNPWIDSGLWHYSRHPNYFGEILLWWGIFIYGASYYTGTYWLTIIGPIFITLLITKVSGIPILEKSADQRWGKEIEYKKYQRNTPILIPNFFKHKS
ncbi:DUF1295 domain-containing protein [Candidatus Nomurabacteria bacterium]|nr:DUF1295 domain-containing protein [Candidatus Nomurabacteria bacterium]